MALFFSLNVLSRKLTSFRYTINQSLLYQNRRSIFTNISGVNFIKNNDSHIPQCPDVEQYFKKIKKSDAQQPHKPKETRWGKNGGNKALTSPAQSFRNQKESQSHNLDNKSTSNNSTHLDVNEGNSNQSKNEGDHHKRSSSQQQTLDAVENKSKSEPHTTTKNTNDNQKRNYLWIACVAAGLGGIAAMYSLKNSKYSSNTEDVRIWAEQRSTSETCDAVIPYKVPYLIIGGGAASYSACQAIRKRVPNAKVLIISNETHPPYMRPKLSKEQLWADISNSNDILRQTYFEPNDFYIDPTRLLNAQNGGVAILNGTAKSLSIDVRKVMLTDGTEIQYDECLLATGSKPQNLLIFRTAPVAIRNRISFYKNISDYQELKEIVDKSESIAVIGGGFIASEISYALAKYSGDAKKLQVYQIFHENGNMGMSLPRYISDWIKELLMDCGVLIMPNTQVDSVKMENSKLKLGLLNGKVVVVNHVIVALGSQPDTEFAQMSGLQLSTTHNGIVVNDYLEAKPHMYVAGDAACLPGSFGKETEKSYDHAIASGHLAGENMTGLKKPFDHQSMFFSNIGHQISFESVGLIDAKLKTVGVFASGSLPDLARSDKEMLNLKERGALPTASRSDIASNLKEDEVNTANRKKGVIFYLRNDEVVGIGLFNVFNKINVARQLIDDGINLNDLNGIGKLFEIDN